MDAQSLPACLVRMTSRLFLLPPMKNSDNIICEVCGVLDFLRSCFGRKYRIFILSHALSLFESLGNQQVEHYESLNFLPADTQPLSVLLQFCHAVQQYLSQDTENAAVFQVDDSTSYLVVACLVWCGLASDLPAAVAQFEACRKISFAAVSSPSQRRYCAYLTELRGVREVPTSQAVSLRSLVLSFLPTSLVQPPLLSIFDYEHSVTKKLVTASRQFSCTDSSASSSVLQIPLNLSLTGDICISLSLELSSDNSEGWNTACVAGFQLHLGMISPGDSIAFTRDEIDGIANDKRFSPDFRIEVQIAHASPQKKQPATLPKPSLLLPLSSDRASFSIHQAGWVSKRNKEGVWSDKYLRVNGDEVSLANTVADKGEPVPLKDITAVLGPTTRYILEPLAKLQPFHGADIRCMTHTNKEVWIGCADGKIYVWHVEQRRLVHEFVAHKSRTTALCFINRTVWSCSADNSVCLWDPTTTNQAHGGQEYQLKKRLQEPHASAVVAMITVDGTYVWTGDASGRVVVWDAKEITALKQLILPRGGMRCMARFGEFVWIGAEMMVHAYHHKTFKREYFWKAHDEEVISIAGACDKLFTRASDGSIRVWHARSLQLLLSVEGLRGAAVDASLAAIDGLIWIFSQDNSLLLWDPEMLRIVEDIKLSRADAILHLLEVRKGTVWTAGQEKSLTVWKYTKHINSFCLMSPSRPVWFKASTVHEAESFVHNFRHLLQQK